MIEQGYADRPALLRRFGEMFFFRYVSPPFSDWFFLLGLEAAGWATLACLATLRDSRLDEDLKTIRVPTLILHGTHDRICTYALGQAQQRAIAGAVLVPFENSGHGLFVEQRTEFNATLARFVQMR